MAGSAEGRISVAISGGGHRATVWGWGALLALVDARLNERVVSIASVSGGSIANGVIANEGDFAAMEPDAYLRAIRPGLQVASRDGLFFFGPATNGYIRMFLGMAGAAAGMLVALLIALVGIGRDWSLTPALVVGPVLAATALIATRRKKGKPAPLPRGMRGALVVGAFAGGLAAPVFLALTTGATELAVQVWRSAILVLATAAVAYGLLRVFSRRSEIVDDALAATLLATAGQPTRLGDVDRKVHHVFCTTELQSGDHAYFTPRLVYSYRAGRGTPGHLRLSTAVQASACLPGAFVPRAIETGQFRMARPWRVPENEPAHVPEHLVVNDGGVYDNMADQWEQGYRGRLDRLRDLHEVQPRADLLLVVNAGKALGWGALAMRNRIGAEVASLGRTIDILYDVSTSHRRQALVDRFNADDKLDGALVHIAQSPYTVPSAFLKSSDAAQRQRAQEALDFLNRLPMTADAWEQRARANAKVKTTLAALTPETTADLLEHAYVLTRVNAYVIHALGDLDGPTKLFERSRFEAMA